MSYTPQFYCFSKKCSFYINSTEKLQSHYMGIHNWTFEQARKKANKTKPTLEPPTNNVVKDKR